MNALLNGTAKPRRSNWLASQRFAKLVVNFVFHFLLLSFLNFRKFPPLPSNTEGIDGFKQSFELDFALIFI